MSNSTQTLDNTPVLADTKQPACHLVPAALPLRTIGRPDTLTAQRVEVAIVLGAMLGRSAALEYLSKHAIDACVMERVLSLTGRRRGIHDASGIRT